MMNDLELPVPPALFEQRYKLLRLLGEGGFARVYLARDIEVEREVAIKILLPRGGQIEPRMAARFVTEARVIASLRDPHTVRLFDFGTSSHGLLYSVFEYVEGIDLAQAIMRRGALGPDVTTHILRQILEALREAHQSGVVHRDIKPANIIVHHHFEDEFAVKLIDFGIARPNETLLAGGRLTKTGHLVGSPRYMAPEQIFGDPVVPATDLYALGHVAIEMLLGRHFVDGSRDRVMLFHATGADPTLPEEVGPPYLCKVLERMVAHEVADRYPSADQVLHDLFGADAHRVVASTPAEPAPQTKRAHLPMLAGGVALVVVALAVMFSADDREDVEVAPRELPSALLARAQQAPPVQPSAAPTLVDVGETFDADSDADAAPPSGCGRPRSVSDVRVPLGDYREGRIFVPSPYQPDVRHTLIVSFRNTNVGPGDFSRRSGFREMVERGEPIVLVGPDNKAEWNTWSDYEMIEDTRKMVDHVREYYCIDPSRIFAIGHGEGARKAHLFACEVPLAGLALSSYAEPPGRPTCSPSPPVPVIHVAGRRDPFVPIDGGLGCAGGTVIAAAEQDHRWWQRNTCKGTPQRGSITGDAECKQYECAAAPYVRCIAEGGFHLGEPKYAFLTPSCTLTRLRLTLADVVWPFFQEQTLSSSATITRP